MIYIKHTADTSKFIEIQSDDVLINSEQDILDLIVDIEYRFDTKKIIINRNNIHESFFDLKTGMAGAIMQKLANYFVKMAIIGNYDNIKNKSFQDYLYETNKNRQVVFVSEISKAIELLN